jgi:hypothetical protein
MVEDESSVEGLVIFSSFLATTIFSRCRYLCYFDVYRAPSLACSITHLFLVAPH